uniref:DNA mismatch repair protein MutS core domain-containing protein n=1 Tax=Physcomitrium patens TaxID=3218 RepID=A0A2K1IGK6_PHYPA|nr:hypothetical protein PHYPA_029001 [Physcomitrium patens]
MPTADKFPEDHQLCDVLERCNVLVIEKKKFDFRSEVTEQDLRHLSKITNRLDFIQEFVEDFELRRDLRSHLRRMPNIERLVSKLQKRKAGLQDVVRLYQAS